MGIKNWASVFSTCNPVNDEDMDVITKFLLSTRVCVLPMTWTSALIGILLAYLDGYLNVLNSLLVVIGLTIAHMSNNLINDYFDAKHGVDSNDYVRNLYAPHPLLSGLISMRHLKMLILSLNILDFLIMIYLVYTVGWYVLLFALLGFFFSTFYVADPIKLKHLALGEVTVFLVWGPLMIGGTYYVISGIVTFKVILLSIPYGLLVTNVLMGKHIDKYELDKNKGIKTLPVVLGIEKSKKLVKLLTWSSLILIIFMVFFNQLTAWALITLLSIPRIMTFSELLKMDKPVKKPYFREIQGLSRWIGTKSILKNIDFNSDEGNWPIWPLWYVAWAFWVNKSIGSLFILALILEIIFPLNLIDLITFIEKFF